MVDGSGLEIRIQDFGLNWTGFAPSGLLFDEFIFFVRVNWTGVDANALIFFERVTFAGYSANHGYKPPKAGTRAYLRRCQ